MTDTHTHLYDEQFDNDRADMIARAKAKGVGKFYLPAIDSSTHEKMLALEAAYPGEIFAMMGLHPTSVQPETWEQELDLVEKYLKQHPFAAIGEIGIDLYWDKSTLDIQQEAFRRQIRMALGLHLPIVIHSRDSFSETFAVLHEMKTEGLRGIFHCFSGNPEQAQEAVSLGFMLGIGGVLTFKNGKIDQFLAEIPLEHIVLETDAPYLAPVPFRGKRNESGYITLVAEKLCDIYGLPYAEIDRITTMNAEKVFTPNLNGQQNNR